MMVRTSTPGWVITAVGSTPTSKPFWRMTSRICRCFACEDAPIFYIADYIHYIYAKMYTLPSCRAAPETPLMSASRKARAGHRYQGAVHCKPPYGQTWLSCFIHLTPRYCSYVLDVGRRPQTLLLLPKDLDYPPAPRLQRSYSMPRASRSARRAE
jgi:hypothetical protein